ncbi:hypothetical protein SEA_WILDER_118 [Mycobacterium phage Wilder]|nr:hypothetical protein SEA_WILDER_118 [Mycobacterium phage Wilder]
MMGGRGGGGGGPVSSRSSTVTLYHRTSASAARDIVDRGFQPQYRPGMDKSYRDENSQYGFFTKTVKGQEGYGQSVVAVEVPKSAVERDPWSGHVRVKVEELRNANFRHYEGKRRKKR